jgi:hypothetical protein
MKMWKINDVFTLGSTTQTYININENIGFKSTTLGKVHEKMVWCYGEHLGEHIGNLIITHWEQKKN